MYTEYLTRVDSICAQLTHPNREVTDDAALNLLITYLTNFLKDDSEDLRNFLDSSTVFKSFSVALVDPEGLNDKNAAFLVELFGIYYTYSKKGPVLDKLKSSFFNLFDNEVFLTTGLLKEAWLKSFPLIYEFTQEYDPEMVKMLNKFRSDSSIFVKRQLSWTTVEFLKIAPESQFMLIIKSIVNDAQSLYSVMLRLKTTNNFSLFEQIITAIIFLQKTSLSEMISDEKYLKIISLYIDMIFQRRQKSKIENLAIICLENLNPVKQMNIFVQLYLLDQTEIKFSFFLAEIEKTIESKNGRNVCIIIDAISIHITHFSMEEKNQFITLIIDNLSKLQSTKEQNMIVTLCEKCFTQISFNALFKILKVAIDNKVSFRVISAINKFENISASNDQIDEIYNIYFGSDWEVKDSVLDFIYKISGSDSIEKFLSIVKECTFDEMGLVRSNSLRVQTELYFKKQTEITEWAEFMKYLIKFISTDLDFNVRRAGLPCLRRMIFEREDLFSDMIKGQKLFTDFQIDEVKPVLDYKRNKVDELGDLFSVLSWDDDWEVKSDLILLIFDMLVLLKRNNLRETENGLQLYALVKRMTKDCDPYVEEKAKDSLNKLESGLTGSEPNFKKPKQNFDLESLEILLNDIELSLQQIHETEILNFSDHEDINFADCY